LREELKRKVKSSLDANNCSRLQNRLDAVEQKSAKAEANLATVDADMISAVQDAIRKLRQERDETASQLELAQTPRKQRLLEQDKRVDAAMKLFSRLREASGKADPVQLRTFLREAIERIEVSVNTEQRGKRTRYSLQGGSITLKALNLYNTDHRFWTRKIWWQDLAANCN
jgi:hypothetical protein